MSKYDAIIIGAGHNGLIAATRLALGGRSVLLLERRAALGGLAVGEPFHPGYHSAGLLFDTSGLRDEVVRELNLEGHGLKRQPGRADVFVANGTQCLLLSGDTSASAAEAERLCPGDGARYKEFCGFLERITPVMRNLLINLPNRVQDLGTRNLWELAKKGLTLRRLGKADMLEIMRISLMCTADWLNEWFKGDLLKAALAAPAHHGAYTGPWSPGTTINLLLRLCGSGKHVVGGSAALIAALKKAADAAGVVARTNAKVTRLHISENRVSAVELANGERIEAPVIMAACHPTHLFYDLVPPEHLPFELETGIRQYRTRGTTAAVHLALAAPLRFKARPEANPSLTRIVSTLDDLERSFDPVKYGNMSQTPTLDIYRPTVQDPNAAPKGGDVATILVHFMPYDLKGGWTDQAKAQLKQIVIEQLARHAPELEQNILATKVVTPADLEADYGLTGGHLYQGEQAIDQLLIRPALPCTDYSTPIQGLYICGSGTRPGGGIDGLAGLQAPTRLK